VWEVPRRPGPRNLPRDQKRRRDCLGREGEAPRLCTEILTSSSGTCYFANRFPRRGRALDGNEPRAGPAFQVSVAGEHRRDKDRRRRLSCRIPVVSLLADSDWLVESDRGTQVDDRAAPSGRDHPGARRAPPPMARSEKASFASRLSRLPGVFRSFEDSRSGPG